MHVYYYYYWPVILGVLFRRYLDCFSPVSPLLNGEADMQWNDHISRWSAFITPFIQVLLLLKNNVRNGKKIFFSYYAINGWPMNKNSHVKEVFFHSTCILRHF